MNTTDLISAIDAEISRLTRARTLLDQIDDSSPSNPRQKASSVLNASTPRKSAEIKRRGRPKGSKNKATSFNPEEFAPKRRTMSATGKARIAAAQRARWAKQKGGAVAKNNSSPAKGAATKPAGKTVSASVKNGPARNPRKPTVAKKSSTRFEVAPKQVPARRVTSKLPAKQTNKTASAARGKQAAAKKSLAKSAVSGPALTGSIASAEAQTTL